MVFSDIGKLLYVNVHKEISEMIDITILNSRAETVLRMKLISGSHSIDLSSLGEKEYSVRLVAGENVWLQRITVGQNPKKSQR